MKTHLMLISALAGLCSAGFAQASELAPMAGLSVKLGDVLGTAYYTVEKDGYHVVTTLGAGEGTPPVRFVSTLLSGQKAIVSVPRSIGENEMILVIERIEDRIFVNDGQKISSVIP